METQTQCKERWSKAFRPLIGRTIRGVRWMDEAEQKKLDWFNSAILI
jgi:hypothetical protein